MHSHNGHETTGSSLQDLDRDQLRSLVWPEREPKGEKNRRAYDVRLLREFGTDAGLLLSRLVYWSGKSHDPEGWIYKTIDQIIEEVGLDSRYAVDKARAKLRDEVEVLEEKKQPRKGWDHGEYHVRHPSPVLHFRVKLAALANRLGLDEDMAGLFPEDDEFMDVPF